LTVTMYFVSELFTFKNMM